MCQMCDEADAYRAQIEAAASKGGKAEKPAKIDDRKPAKAARPA